MGRYVIPYFEGLDESLGPLAGNAAAARVARNVATDHGRLSSAAGFSEYIPQAVPGEAESLYVFCETDTGGVVTEYVVAGTQDGVYVWRDNAWQQLFAGTAGGWGFLSYKKNEDSILIFGNGVDEVQCWDGVAQRSSVLEGVPAKGKYFALHYERVWMCGDEEAPDRLYYSRMLNPNDWTGDAATPEIGGGFVDLPTFDGGVITNLYGVGGDLCILKSTTALLLYGTSPENYQVTRMSGEMGTIAGKTAAVYGQTGYFVSAQGICLQSGTTIVLMDDRKLPHIFSRSYCTEEEACTERLNERFGASAAGMCFGERLWFSLPLGAEECNNALIEYDVARETYIVHDGCGIVGFARAGRMRERMLVLCDDGRVRMYGEGSPAAARWTTPWMDFGSNGEKIVRSISLYGQMTSPNGMPAVTVTVESERGKKQRVLAQEQREDKLFKRRMRLGGRRFRIHIEAAKDTRFCFTGGLEIETEG